MSDQNLPNRPKRTPVGSVDDTTGPHFLIIGRVLRPHGIRGEVRVAIHTDLPDRYSWLEHVHLSRDPDDPSPPAMAVEKVRFHQGQVLLKLVDSDTRNDAELLRGLWVLVAVDEAIPLADGEYFRYQLEGLEVFTEDGSFLGVLDEVLETGANDVFVVRGDAGEVLIPNIEQVILNVDLKEGRMTIRVLPGLLP